MRNVARWLWSIFAGDHEEVRELGPPPPPAIPRPQPQQAGGAGSPHAPPARLRALTRACSSCPPTPGPAPRVRTAACGQPCFPGCPPGFRWCVSPASRVARRPAELCTAQTRSGRPPAAGGEHASAGRPCVPQPSPHQNLLQRPGAWTVAGEALRIRFLV